MRSTRRALSTALRCRNGAGGRTNNNITRPSSLTAALSARHSGTNVVGNDTRSFSAVALQQQQHHDDSPDYTHLYNNTSYHPSTPEPNYTELGPTSKLNLFTAINSAMQTAMETDPTAIMFGEDVAFGGVFRCSQNLREEYGEDRVFNTPLSENGIAVSCIFDAPILPSLPSIFTSPEFHLNQREWQPDTPQPEGQPLPKYNSAITSSQPSIRYVSCVK